MKTTRPCRLDHPGNAESELDDRGKIREARIGNKMDSEVRQTQIQRAIQTQEGGKSMKSNVPATKTIRPCGSDHPEGVESDLEKETRVE